MRLVVVVGANERKGQELTRRVEFQSRSIVHRGGNDDTGRMTRLRTQGRSSAAWVGLLVTSVLAAGCGSSHSSTSNANSANSANSVNAANTARIGAAQCIRRHGINIPDPTPGGAWAINAFRILNGYPQSQTQAALNACAAQIHKAFPQAFNLTPAQQAQRRQQGMAFAQCMRSRHIAIPDPPVGLGGTAAYLHQLSSIDRNSPAIRSAAATCRKLAMGGQG
jgi:hypothetical protein